MNNQQGNPQQFIREFTKPGQITKHLNCAICSEVFLDPSRLGCGHTYCIICIQTWLNSNNQCPECRQQINMKHMSKDLIATKIIDDYEIFCYNKKQNCTWKGPYSSLKRHFDNCSPTDAEIPEWIKQFQKTLGSEDKQNQLHYPELQYDENLIDKMNENVEGNLLSRLLNKNPNLFTKQNQDEELKKKQIKQKAIQSNKNSMKKQDIFEECLGYLDENDFNEDQGSKYDKNRSVLQPISIENNFDQQNIEQLQNISLQQLQQDEYRPNAILNNNHTLEARFARIEKNRVSLQMSEISSQSSQNVQNDIDDQDMSFQNNHNLVLQQFKDTLNLENNEIKAGDYDSYHLQLKAIIYQHQLRSNFENINYNQRENDQKKKRKPNRENGIVINQEKKIKNQEIHINNQYDYEQYILEEQKQNKPPNQQNQ